MHKAKAARGQRHDLSARGACASVCSWRRGRAQSPANDGALEDHAPNRAERRDRERELAAGGLPEPAHRGLRVRAGKPVVSGDHIADRGPPAR
jgi:hypothetical protein